ncbi:MAG: right-handed parallel beta-helix repeat-containing protein, partial [Acidobacteriota bacterium]|nr:right-handed parallel beta-helix repeat-containing protein [Acidobacteriota bacterium]
MQRSLPGRWLPLAMMLLGCCLVASAQTTVYVDDDACPGSGDGSSGSPYCEIQEGVCAIRVAGGTVMVRPGTYLESIRMLGGVSVVSTDGPAVTTIDATGRPCIRQSDCLPSTINLTCSAVVFGSGTLATDRLEGFRITGGDGLFRDFGAGTPPNAVTGAGVFVFDSSPIITNNEIVTNDLSHGGTKYFFGGGVYLFGSSYATPTNPVVTYNLIEDNSANSPQGQNQNNISYSWAGGLYIGQNVEAVVTDNTIRQNKSGDISRNHQIALGGGIVSYGLVPGMGPNISRNVIVDNEAADRGGGLFLGTIYSGSTYFPTQGLFDSNVFDQNVGGFLGGGVYVGTSAAEFHNNTLTDNTAEFGGGAAIGPANDPGSETSFINNIIVFNTATPNDGGGIAISGSSDPEIRYNDLFGNTPDNIGLDKVDGDYIGSDNNISLDPLFVDFNLATRDLHLSAASPVIDEGDNTVAGAIDLDGNPRVQDG